jgi:hypothetical protein
MIWGVKWEKNIAGFATEVLALEWAEGLAGATPEEIARGLSICRATCPWPPSIAEFRTACALSHPDDQRARNRGLTIAGYSRRTPEQRAAGLRCIANLLSLVRH